MGARHDKSDTVRPKREEKGLSRRFSGRASHDAGGVGGPLDAAQGNPGGAESLVGVRDDEAPWRTRACPAPAEDGFP